jgi:hypothetical protein
MRVLFLDDNRNRREQFTKNSISHSVDLAVTAEQAIDFLRENSYDLIFLDHDLDFAHYDGDYSKGKSGLDVAKFLKTCEHQFGKIVFVHSLNPDGRKNIKSHLVDSFRVYLPEDIGEPFLWSVELKYLLESVQSSND